MDEKKKRALSFLSIREKKDEPLEYRNVDPEDSEEKISEDLPPGETPLPRVKQPALAQPILAEPEEDDFDFFKYIGIILNRKYWFMGVFALVVIVGMYLNSKSQKKYKSSARLAVKIHPVEDAVGNIFYGSFAERAYMASNHYENLKTPDDQFLEIVRELMDSSLSKKSISSLYRIKKEEESDMLIINVVSPSRVITEKLANAVAKAYESYDLQFRQKNFSEKENWISEQINIRAGHLEELELEIKEFKESHPTFSPTSFSNEIMNLESKLRTLVLSIEENNQKLKLASRAFNNTDSVVVAEVTRDRPLQKELLNLQIELAKMKVSFGEKSRQVYKIKEQLNNLQELLDRDLEQKTNTTILQSNPRYQSLQVKMDELNEAIKVKQSRKNEMEKMLEDSYRKFATKPELQLEFSRMERERAASEKIYSMLKEKLEETKLKKSGVNREIFQIGQATKGRLISTGGVNLWALIGAAILISFGVCLGVEKMDKTVRFPTDIEKKYGIPVLGIIPELEIGASKIDLNSDSKIIEPYRNLRTNLNYSFLNNTTTPRSIIITSALQGEGKSTKAVNLAICFSLEGKKVLIVDADLRRPSVHGLLDREKGPGLGEYLTGQATFKEIIQLTSYQGLHLIAAGDKMPNPSEILGNPRINKFLAMAKSSFDVVFFDSPAIFPVSDALVLAPLIDGVIVVFRSNYTPVKAGEEVIKKLSQVGTDIIGGVLNDVSMGKGKYYYSYYGYYGYSYYHNYYEDTPDVNKKSLTSFFSSTVSNSLKELKKKSVREMEKMKMTKDNSKTGGGSPKKNKTSLMDILIIVVFGLIIFTGIAAYMFSKQKLPEFIPISEFEENSIIKAKKRVKKEDPGTSTQMEDSLFIVKQITNWANGWGGLNLPLYLSTYSVLKYKYAGGYLDDWKKFQERNFNETNEIKLKIQNISVQVLGDSAHSEFLFSSEINKKKSQVIKLLSWSKEDKNWLISSENEKKVDREIGAALNNEY